MAARRAVRSTRRDDEDELVEEPEDELADEPEDELAEEPEDEQAEPEDELADEEPEDELADEEPEEADGKSATRHSRRGGIKAAKAGQLAMRQIAELTGKAAEGITGVEPGDDGWIVGVEVVEDRRIPSSTDVLATYETELDADGELVSYRRVRRYGRGRGDSEDS